jgi:oligosaccharide repeat unit polymerase
LTASIVACFFLAGLLGLVAFDCRREVLQLVSARNVFLLTMCFWYLAETILQPSAIHEYSQTEAISALACVLLCLVTFGLAYQRLYLSRREGNDSALPELNQPQFLWHAFWVTALIGFVPLLVLSRGNIWTIFEDAFYPKPRWSSLFQRGRYGDGRDALLEMQMFLRAATPLAAAIVLGHGHKAWQRSLAGLLLIYMVARGLHDGSRFRLVEAVVPIAAAFFWRVPFRWKRPALLLALPVVFTVSLVWAAAAVRGRDEGRFAWRDAFSVQYVGFEMFRELLFLRRTVPNTSPWQWGYTYYVQAINPIPRFLWTSKPIEDAGLQLAVLQKAVVDGEPKLTIAPGLIGEMYWNFGIPGIAILSALLGMILRWWDAVGIQARQSLPLYTVFASGLYVVFATGRSVNLSTAYGLLSLYATVKVLCWWKAREATGS